MPHYTLTAKEVAAELRCHPKTILRLLRTGTLHGFKLQREWRIDRQSLDEFKRRGDYTFVIKRNEFLTRRDEQGGI